MSADQDIATFQADWQRLREQLARRIVGQHDVIEHVLTALMADGHVLLEGVPGLGKTLLVRTLAEVLGCQFARIQFTPDLMPADITGTNILVESPTEGGRLERRFEFQRGPIFTSLLLADEINRATPKTQSALLEAMQEGAVTVGRATLPLPSPFWVLATQNPIDMEGTYPLPEAQLDRFFFKLVVPPPSRQDLHAILDRTTNGVDPQPLQAALTHERLQAMRALVRRIPVARPMQDLAVRLVEATHPNGELAAHTRTRVRLGASPRGAQALVLAAKVRALAQGRPTPSFADVRAHALPALRHRVLLTFEGEAETGGGADALLTRLLEATPDLEKGAR